MSPRQFGLLYKAKVEHGTQVKFMKDHDRNQFLDNRDMVRLMDEQREACRRRKVLSGEWTEEASQDLMQDVIREANENEPELKDDAQF